MSTWQGFDQRKICPECGEYQTRVEKKERQSFSSFALMRYIGVIIIPIIPLILLSLRPLNVYLLGLFFMGFVGLVVFFAYRSIYSGGRETICQASREENWIGYSLRCHNCGHTWEMTVEEWETVGRKERENFINFPSRFPSSKGNLDKPSEGIEWKSPNPNKGIFIVIGFIGVSLIVSLLLYGVFWAKAHHHTPYAIVVNGIIAIFALFVYAGLALVFKPKTDKIVFIFLILVTLIGLVLAVYRFLLA